MWKRTTILKGIFDYRSVFITYGKEIESKGLLPKESSFLDKMRLIKSVGVANRQSSMTT